VKPPFVPTKKGRRSKEHTKPSVGPGREEDETCFSLREKRGVRQAKRARNEG